VRHGVRIGVDVGKVRIGVARCDPSGLLATPLQTVARTKDGSDVAHIAALAIEYDAIEIVVGLPLALSGRQTASTEDALGFASGLASAVQAPVRMVDERLSTVTAQAGLKASGRTTKNSRGVVDQAAATVILQHALDAERTAGRPPGVLAETRIGPSS